MSTERYKNNTIRVKASEIPDTKFSLRRHYKVVDIIKAAHIWFPYKHPIPNVLTQDEVNLILRHKHSPDEVKVMNSKRVDELCREIFGKESFRNTGPGRYRWTGESRWQNILGGICFRDLSDLTLFKMSI